MTELLGMDGLDLKVANGTDLPYEGWVELTFNLIEDKVEHKSAVLGCQGFLGYAYCWI